MSKKRKNKNEKAKKEKNNKKALKNKTSIFSLLSSWINGIDPVTSKLIFAFVVVPIATAFFIGMQVNDFKREHADWISVEAVIVGSHPTFNLPFSKTVYKYESNEDGEKITGSFRSYVYVEDGTAISVCVNPETGISYTYFELSKELVFSCIFMGICGAILMVLCFFMEDPSQEEGSGVVDND